MKSKFKVVSTVFIPDLGNAPPKLHTIKTGLKRTEAERLRDKLLDKQGDFDPSAERIVTYLVQPS